jgi:hypothetical protein
MYPPLSNKRRSTRKELSGHITHFYAPYGPGDIFYWYNHRNKGGLVDLVEEAYSENHPGWRKLRGNPQNIGGPFFVMRNGSENWGAPVTIRKSFKDVNWEDVYIFSGNAFHIPLGDMKFPAPINSSESDMNMMGATGVARAAPGKSKLNLATSLGELKKDGLPSLISTFQGRASVAKKAGDSYLNAQFGWKPLVNDVKSVANVVSSGGSILSQLERDAGKHVRRRVTVLEETDTSEVSLGKYVPNINGMTSSDFGPLIGFSDVRLQTTTYRKVWFSGSFTYYLPPSYYSRNKFMRAATKADQLLGLKLTPSVLWNLAPWSWAADWVSNAGDVISNTERFLSEGLVMHHGYVMEHTVHEHMYTFDNDCIPPARLYTETKSRVPANPFGFGVKWPDLSGFQLSIIGALGMSRGG